MPVQEELQFTRMRVVIVRPKRKIALTDFDNDFRSCYFFVIVFGCLFLVFVVCLFVVVWRFILLTFTGSQ